jgi:hypothetical protein
VGSTFTVRIPAHEVEQISSFPARRETRETGTA